MRAFVVLEKGSAWEGSVLYAGQIWTIEQIREDHSPIVPEDFNGTLAELNECQSIEKEGNWYIVWDEFAIGVDLSDWKINRTE